MKDRQTDTQTDRGRGGGRERHRDRETERGTRVGVGWELLSLDSILQKKKIRERGNGASSAYIVNFSVDPPPLPHKIKDVPLIPGTLKLTFLRYTQ